MTTAADQFTRDQALDPAQSFIVQAPAGSGKTELLMQRYLALLATVEHPEEIIAITFTRKATAEMRGRILASLDKAAGSENPDQAHEQKTWQLAQQVLIRDKELNWNLQQNPNRLRILTIDALCASLARQMPVLSRAGVNPVTVTDARDLYQQAARATLQELSRSPDVAFLLGHLDNNWQKLEAMITSLLQKRDHWLRHLPVTGELKQERENLEASLCAIINETLEQTLEKLSDDLIEDWIKLANYAAQNLTENSQKDGKEIPLSACAGIQQMPDPFPENLHLWEGLIELVLTQADGWRKTVNKNQGFPAPSGDQKQFQAEMKSAVPQLIEQLQNVPDLLEDLRAIRLLPKPSYSDDQWDVLQALFVVLKLAVAQLQIVFREQGKVDFTEVSIAAVYALGHAEQPTDLALALDYKIKHLLVDEFQDTSVSQYSLLERITVGWEMNDDRTLFLVGDPMQSIYRFREADVGLFINVQQQQSLGHVQLTPLQLSVNFRSERAVVDWVNKTFSRAMPSHVSVTSGAVSYTLSEAFNDQSSAAAVTIHPLIDADKKQEAELVCDQVRLAVERNDSVAILVRSKSHLVQITTQLKDQKLAYQAVEIETLAQQPVIRDLYSLTCALLHLADKTAWLAILRAPWCGLTLADLELLVEKSGLPIWTLINDSERIKTLSDDGQGRIARLQTVFDLAIKQQRRVALSRWVEGVWISLGGPACLQNDSDLEDAKSFFELLNGLDEGGELASLDVLEQAIAGLFATPMQSSTESLPQLMTIHKSKGLEFDTVILPALDRQSKNDDRQLLQWTEWHNVHEDKNELLLAPIEEVGHEKERINLYLASLEKQRTRHETVRLLYVATTRARQHLHLIGRVEHNNKGELKSPDQRSLLARIWPSVEPQFISVAEEKGQADQTEEQIKTFTPTIRRLPVSWTLPDLPGSVQWQNDQSDLKQKEELREFSWAGEPARHIGTVVHRLLQQVAQEDSSQWDQLQSLIPLIETLLLESGLSKTMLPMAVKRVCSAIERTLQDDRGQWIMSKDHQNPRNEYALTGIVDGEMMNVILDRTFIDEKGTRWIIDYKTGGHEGGGLESFLDNEQLRYKDQLERYAKLMAQLEDRPIRLALYFTQLGGWREWEPNL